MIANLNRSVYLSPEDYLAWEEKQEFRHEYIDGKIYAMTGGTLTHNGIAVNLVALLRSHLRSKGCKVFVNDVKVQVSRNGPYFYPDLVVTCDERDLKSKSLVRYPCLIIEVLSPSTANYDRGKKFRYYRKLKSLKEYVLISADTIGVEYYRLNANQKWELDSYFPDFGESKTEADVVPIDFPCIDFSCAIADIYEDVELEPEGENQTDD